MGSTVCAATVIVENRVLPKRSLSLSSSIGVEVVDEEFEHKPFPPGGGGGGGGGDGGDGCGGDVSGGDGDDGGGGDGGGHLATRMKRHHSVSYHSDSIQIGPNGS